MSGLGLEFDQDRVHGFVRKILGQLIFGGRPLRSVGLAVRFDGLVRFPGLSGLRLKVAWIFRLFTREMGFSKVESPHPGGGRFSQSALQ